MMRHNSVMKQLKSLIITFILSNLLVFHGYTLAADAKTETWYQIEVLVYEPVENAIAGESWPAITNSETPETAIQLASINPAATNMALVNSFQQLPTKTLVLSDVANKLISSRRYRVITFQGWQQPVKQRSEAEAVYLTDKQTNIGETNARPVTLKNGEIILNPQSENKDLQTFNQASITNQGVPAKINGTVTVSLSRYLHMALKLNYYNPDVYLAEQVALQKPDEALINTFMMKQSRKMRSKEVHVFDHPYFGVIATITPIERAIGKTR